MTSTRGIEKSLPTFFHDVNSKRTYSIEEIKQIFRYEKLPFRRIYKGEQKTEYLSFLDEEKRILLTMHQNLVAKINGERSYNKIKLGQPGFSKFNEVNVIKIDLIDEGVIT